MDEDGGIAWEKIVTIIFVAASIIVLIILAVVMTIPLLQD